MSRPLLEIRHLNRSYGRVKAVDRLSFTMNRGEIYGFIGPNGAGKTTTMRILATLDVPDSGNAWVNGVSVLENPREVRRTVGFMSDQFTPYANLNVMEYLDFFARAQGLRGKKRLDTVRSVASFCNLTGFASRPATGLSKGMGQRLHLAKTLLHDPDLLVLDEPASGLDPRARIELRELIRELASAGKGVFISSHILTELSETCDGVIVIEKGKRVVSGTIEEVSRLAGGKSTLQVRVLQDPAAAHRFLITQPGVTEVEVSEGRLYVTFDGGDDALADLLTRAVQAKLGVIEFRSVDANLEDIFMRTTKGKLQ